ncbi:hypothetical protein MKEN_01503700 [Mycena kentingensis (nom. inval.)]|nr:hypothetical protein MKEN_01503700 [Mycena kentingensis (nom. inval.)]
MLPNTTTSSMDGQRRRPFPFPFPFHAAPWPVPPLNGQPDEDPEAWLRATSLALDERGVPSTSWVPLVLAPEAGLLGEEVREAMRRVWRMLEKMRVLEEEQESESESETRWAGDWESFCKALVYVHAQHCQASRTSSAIPDQNTLVDAAARIALFTLTPLLAAPLAATLFTVAEIGMLSAVAAPVLAASQTLGAGALSIVSAAPLAATSAVGTFGAWMGVSTALRVGRRRRPAEP